MLDLIIVLLVFVSAGILFATSFYLLALLSHKIRNGKGMTRGRPLDFWAYHGGELIVFLSALLTVIYIMEMIEEHPRRATYLIADFFAFGSVLYCLHKISAISAHMQLAIKVSIPLRKILQCTLWLLLVGTTLFVLEDFITKRNYYIVVSLTSVLITIIQFRWMQTFMSIGEFTEAATNSSIIGFTSRGSTEDMGL